MAEGVSMPFARTWSEELVAEWLQLEGYSVEIGVPVVTPKKGGRREADIVGARVKDGVLEIFHVEVGVLSGSAEKNIQGITNKFSKHIRESLKKYFSERFGIVPSNKVSYNSMYIAASVSRKTVTLARQTGIPLIKLEDFIRQKIIPTISEWKKKAPHRPKWGATPPEGLWLLCLIDYMNQRGLITQ